MAHNDDARVADLLSRLGDDGVRDLFRRLLERALQELIDAEVTTAIGAARHERTETRTNHRNGGRTRLLSTPAGDVELRIRERFPAAAELLDDAEADVTAYADFPRAPHKKIASTNPLERVHKEIPVFRWVQRRINVVGIFPDDASVIRLVGAILLETHDEWQTADRRYLSEGSMALIDRLDKEVITTPEHPQLPAA